ncbi:MAG: LPS-assembly protein LptD [Pseudomonadales bacterium]|nr:LPS-assembly protein LptD [Pseudomonadales bacterium]
MPRNALAPADLAGMPPYCEGRYVLPAFPHPLDSDPDDFPIVGDAENVTYWLDGRVSLRGAVTLSQGNRRITGREASLDQAAGEGLMTGQVQVIEPNLLLDGQRARVDLDSRAARLEGVEFLMPAIGLRGAAATIVQDADGNLVISDGSFTRCEPGNRNWGIEVASLEMSADDVFGTARSAVVKVRGVPILYAPYLRFPVRDDRQSGLLFPDLGFSERHGLDLRVPYYLNLAPNYDATLAPRYIADRGVGLEGEFRHLADWQRTTLTGAYLHKDDLFDGTLTRNDFNTLAQQGLVTGEFKPEDRWLYGIDHEGEIGRFRTLIDYRAVSDRDYFRDLGGDIGLSSRIELERRAEIAYAAGGMQMRLWAQRFDRLDEGTIDPYQRLPQFDARYTRALFGPLEASVAAQLASFYRQNDPLQGLDRAVGQRVHVEPRLRLPFYTPWGFLTFAGGYRHTAYHLDDLPDGFDRDPERNVGFGSIHGGMYFDRRIESFGRQVIHSLEPQAFYLYQGYARQSSLPRFDASELTFGYPQLFRDNRFSGLDRVGDANHLALGVTSRLVDAANGVEYLRGSLGQILYFRDRRVTLTEDVDSANRQSTSAIAGEVSGRVARDLRLTSTVIWDPNLNQVDEGAILLEYRRDDQRILNLGYRDRLRDDVSQVDASGYWPVTRHLGVLARWNYDLEKGRIIEAFGGLEYNDCCWQIRLLARRFLNIPTGANIVTGQEFELVQPDNGIFLQIVFKGMGGFGNSLESMLSRGIRGYRTENYHEF